MGTEQLAAVGDDLCLVWSFVLFVLLESVLPRHRTCRREGEWILGLGQFLRMVGDHRDPTVEGERERKRGKVSL